jgi:hypothetical protein
MSKVWSLVEFAAHLHSVERDLHELREIAKMEPAFGPSPVVKPVIAAG